MTGHQWIRIGLKYSLDVTHFGDVSPHMVKLMTREEEYFSKLFAAKNERIFTPATFQAPANLESRVYNEIVQIFS